MFKLYYWLALLSLLYCATGVQPKSKASIIVAGNFSIDGKIVNIAQYDVSSGSWSTAHRSELFVYGAESNGVIWDISINRTSNPYDSMFIVGTFDTDTRASQIQLCSVSAYDGVSFSKVGEGICPKGVECAPPMQLYTSALGSNGDLYVGGTFESRVWTGSHFEDVYHVARFDARTTTWLPLMQGELMCNDGSTARVNSLAWDAEMSILYLAGNFHSVGNTTITSGLAMWSKITGLLDFPGGGVQHSDGGVLGTQVKALAYEPKSMSLFVSGVFRQVNDKPCNGIAVWTRWSNQWRCLADDAHSISVVTAMLLTATHLYLTGWAASTSTWRTVNADNPYAVARMDVSNFITANDARNYDIGSYHQRSRDQYLAELLSAHEQRRLAAEGAHSLESAVVEIGTEIEGSFQPHRYRGYPFASRSMRFQPEDHPCMTEDWKPVCGKRRSRHLLVGSHALRRRRLSRSHDGTRFNSTYRHSVAADSAHQANNTRILAEAGHTISESIPRAASPLLTQTGIGTGGADSWNNTKTQWEWLAGFKGTNGPIFSLTAGRESLRNAIIIAGAFNNYPALVIWSQNPDPALASISAVPGSGSLAGLITSVVQANVPFDAVGPNPPSAPPTPSPPIPPKIRTDYAFLVVAGGIGMGIVLGLVLAIGCLSRAGFQFVNLPSNIRFGGGNKPESPFGSGMSLVTLSGNAPGALADFRICFERAMSARHLPTHETLLIINPQEIVLSRIIGEGSFGRVWNGQWRNSAVAVKEFVFAQAAIEGGSLQHNSIIEEIVGEAGIMACLRHPKILQLYGCSLTMQAIWIVSELCIKGSLRMVLSHQSMPLSLETKLTLCMDIADGMDYLHSRTPPIIHRDLKSLNIFITETSQGTLVAKIGDWGSARAVALSSGPKSMTQGVGTACWLSPEVISHAHFSKHSDVYAFGIILWEVFTRLDVYAGLSAAQIISKVAHEGLRPKVPRGCPWKSIMTSCWQVDATQRPSFHTVLVELNRMYQVLKTQGPDELAALYGMEDDLIPEDDSPAYETDALIPVRLSGAQSSSEASGYSQGYALASPQPPLLHPQVQRSSQSQPPVPLATPQDPSQPAESLPAVAVQPFEQFKLTTPENSSTAGSALAHGGTSGGSSGGGGGSAGPKRSSPLKGVLKHPSSHSLLPPATVPGSGSLDDSSHPTPRTNMPPPMPGLPSTSPGTSPAQPGGMLRHASIAEAAPEASVDTEADSNSSSNYRNELPLNFDVSDLIGPTYYIVDNQSEDDADPLDFLFSDHRRRREVGRNPANNGSTQAFPTPSPPPTQEVYAGDKPLKPYVQRRRSGSGGGSAGANSSVGGNIGSSGSFSGTGGW